jgi:transcriptional regulator with XRE-family HTH domain
MSTLGKEIKKARIEQGLMQKDLRERTGLSQKYLSQIENDAVDPRASVLKRIAKALHVSTDRLLCLERAEPPTTNGTVKRDRKTRSKANKPSE